MTAFEMPFSNEGQTIPRGLVVIDRNMAAGLGRQVEALLKRLGLRPVLTTDADGALDSVLDAHPALVMIHAEREKLSSALAMIARVKAAASLRDAVIVTFGTDCDVMTAFHLILAGAADCVRLPIDAETLEQRLHQAGLRLPQHA